MRMNLAHLMIREELHQNAAERREAMRLRLQKEIGALRNRQMRSKDQREKTFLETKITSLRRAYMRGRP